MKLTLQRAIRIAKSGDQFMCQLPGPKGTVLYRGSRAACRIHKRNTITTLLALLMVPRNRSERFEFVRSQWKGAK